MKTLKFIEHIELDGENHMLCETEDKQKVLISDTEFCMYFDEEKQIIETPLFNAIYHNK